MSAEMNSVGSANRDPVRSACPTRRGPGGGAPDRVHVRGQGHSGGHPPTGYTKEPTRPGSAASLEGPDTRKLRAAALTSRLVPR